MTKTSYSIYSCFLSLLSVEELPEVFETSLHNTWSDHTPYYYRIIKHVVSSPSRELDRLYHEYHKRDY